MADPGWLRLGLVALDGFRWAWPLHGRVLTPGRPWLSLTWQIHGPFWPGSGGCLVLVDPGSMNELPLPCSKQPGLVWPELVLARPALTGYTDPIPGCQCSFDPCWLIQAGSGRLSPRRPCVLALFLGGYGAPMPGFEIFVEDPSRRSHQWAVIHLCIYHPCCLHYTGSHKCIVCTAIRFSRTFCDTDQ